MSSSTKHSRAKALAVARELTAALRPLCEPERFIFAGSLRRLKPEVGDIELVYIPRVEMQSDPDDLLDNRIPTNLFNQKLDEWLKVGVLSRRVGPRGGTSWGPANKLAVHNPSGIGLDFFAADQLNFWTMLVCRTGSMESNTRVASAAIKLGQTWNMYRGFEDRVANPSLGGKGSLRQPALLIGGHEGGSLGGRVSAARLRQASLHAVHSDSSGPTRLDGVANTDTLLHGLRP